MEKLFNQMRRWPLHFIVPAIIIFLSILLFLVLVNGGRSKNAAVSEEKAWRVQAILAKQANYKPNLILQGVTESPHEATIKAAITADVSETLVYEGTQVKKGQLLIKLDDREATFIKNERLAEVNDIQAQIRAEYTRAKNDAEALKHEKELLALAEKNMQRQLTLLKKQVGSEAAFDDAKRTVRQQALAVTNRNQSVEDHTNRLMQLQARLQRAQAQLDQAKLDLSRTKIRAPFAGRITALRVSPGNRVRVGDELIELYDNRRLEIRAQIPTQYVSRAQKALSNKQDIRATAIINNQKIELILERLAAEVGTGRAGVDGLFRILSIDQSFGLGRATEVYVDLPEIKNVYKVPNRAVYNTNRVYIAKDGRMQAVTVKRMGLVQNQEADTEALIKSDAIQDGDLIITTPLPNARTGLRIEVVK